MTIENDGDDVYMYIIFLYVDSMIYATQKSNSHMIALLPRERGRERENVCIACSIEKTFEALHKRFICSRGNTWGSLSCKCISMCISK